ncbi:uncharacterized protein LOC108089994 [Drosophila ficusphila]|uniref:uncharacterized protein LOC108089994 n=1 Tax=Drosophila ficusphila TaxID=30025 RepID=UPI001C890B1E|nr:uncharacterized protein LOC108089994 [Drosophila ficusphila]
MNRKIPYFSQNSNQPLGADFHLDEQMFLKWQNNGKSKTNLSSDRTYNRYVKTLLRVQNSIHRRFPPRRTKSSHDHRSRTSGGECSKGCGESEPKRVAVVRPKQKNRPVKPLNLIAARKINLRNLAAMAKINVRKKQSRNRQSPHAVMQLTQISGNV